MILKSTVINEKSINTLDHFLVMRCFAACCVFLSHASEQVTGLKESLILLNLNWSWLLFANGRVGVAIFFTLSGYLMGKLFYSGRYTLSLNGIMRFARNRFFRIAPLYYFLTLLFAVFVYHTAFQLQNRVDFLSIFIFQFPVKNPPILPATFWSIPVEVQFYALVPIIILLLKPYLKKGLQIVAIAVLLIGAIELGKFGIFQYYQNPLHFKADIADTMYSNLWSNLDLFLIGFFLNLLLPYLLKRFTSGFFASTKVRFSIAWGGLFILYLVTAWLNFDYGKSSALLILFMYPLLTGIITSLAILLIESIQMPEARQSIPLSIDSLWRNPLRLFEWLGTLSYGIYLWHYPIIVKPNRIWPFEYPLFNFIYLLSLGFLITVLLSAITYGCIERPINRLKKLPLRLQHDG